MISAGVCNEPREASAKSCILPTQPILEDASMASYNEISVSTLARLVGTPDWPAAKSKV